MRRLLPTPRFERQLRRFVKKNPDLDKRVEQTLAMLRTDPFAPMLGTHKLKGEFYGLSACSCGYDCRIVFSLQKDPQTNEEVVLLHFVGTHDQVY
ncbi:MAG: type II toxin-antitoxin system YafQ family toxin [Ignavibacteriae bacterium]|nr:type II toxin-antitoxin system YafQ family toxin [Ignavibacteriota bacterium]